MWEKKRSSPGGASRQGEDKVRMADIRGGTKRSATLTFLFWRWCWSQGFSSFLKNPCSNAMEDPIYYAVKSSNWKLTRETKLAVPSWWSSGLSCLTKSNKGAPFLLFTECLLCLCVRVREREENGRSNNRQPDTIGSTSPWYPIKKNTRTKAPSPFQQKGRAALFLFIVNRPGEWEEVVNVDRPAPNPRGLILYGLDRDLS